MSGADARPWSPRCSGSLTLKRQTGARPCAYLRLSDEPYEESAADARGRAWPVAEISGVGHLAMATEPIPVTDALLELERLLLEPA